VIATVAVGAIAVWLGKPDDHAPPSDTVADGNRLVVGVADGKTIAEWTPGCAFEVQTERRADGKLWACYTFDPGECFVARLADAGRSKKPPTVGQSVFVSLTAARDRWAAGTVKQTDGQRFYVEVRSGLQCSSPEKPALWANVENIVAAPQ
jgi:hypothetical protein